MHYKPSNKHRTGTTINNESRTESLPQNVQQPKPHVIIVCYIYSTSETISFQKTNTRDVL